MRERKITTLVGAPLAPPSLMLALLSCGAAAIITTSAALPIGEVAQLLEVE